ncbi:transposase [Cellulomonas sp. B6]|uniref:transposase n=1 Tax=Cellulomonas sp. B6 TaxID=1295626 RepID=UPI00350FBA94
MRVRSSPLPRTSVRVRSSPLPGISVRVRSRARLLTVPVTGCHSRRAWRAGLLTDEAWTRVEPLMPAASVEGGRPLADHRRVVEAIIWR